MSNRRYFLARILGFIYPALYATLAAVGGAMAIQNFRNSDITLGIAWLIPCGHGLFLLYKSVVRWKYITDKLK